VEGDLNERLTRIETKLDDMMVQLPRFVTWGRLGGAITAIATIVIAALNLIK
jgi:hypothetical protein